MSLRNNILANYASQLYVALIGIVMVPMYVRYMGAEAYGLVGFFAMLQAWFQLLDLGLTPTMARESARYEGGGTDALSLRRLLRALEVIFAAIAIGGALGIAVGADAIATHWLKVRTLPLAEVALALTLMGAVVALRWMGGLYRGVINGFERALWLGGFSSIVATARFVLVIPVMLVAGATPAVFFSYQLAIAVLELGVLMLQCYRLMPPAPAAPAGAGAVAWDWTPLRQVLRFSLTIAFTSAVWVMVTQTDKLLLSKMLSLADYGYYTLGVLVASAISMIGGPVSMALLPRLTRLGAEGDGEGLLRLYGAATQLITLLAVPAALVLACFAEQVLWAWTGDAALARQAAPVLALYALGNSVLAIGAFPYYLQYAKGDLKLHLIGNLVFVLVLVPALVWATLRFGAVGAGYAWLGTNLVYLAAFVPLVHRRLAPGTHGRWLAQFLPIAALAALALAPLHYWLGWPAGRFATALQLGAVGALVLLAAALGSAHVRGLAAARLPARLSF